MGKQFYWRDRVSRHDEPGGLVWELVEAKAPGNAVLVASVWKYIPNAFDGYRSTAAPGNFTSAERAKAVTEAVVRLGDFNEEDYQKITAR